MRNKALLICFCFPFLVGCGLFTPQTRSESSNNNSSFSIEPYSGEESSSSDSSSKEEEDETVTPKNNPHYPVTIEEQPPVTWDSAQANLRKGIKTLDFYNINDIHGIIDEDDNYAGIRKISSYLKSRQTGNPNGYVFTSSGDSWQGSADSNMTRGALMDDWLSYVDCSAMALGNHEFDWTIDTLVENELAADFPFLACNIIRSDNHEVVDWVRPFTTITRNGINIGIIGAIGENIMPTILASNIRGLSFADPLPYVTQWSNYLKDNGADIILFLYHYTTNGLSNQYVSLVDGVFGGHSHSFENNTLDYVPAVQAGAYGRALAHINLRYDFDANEVSSSYGEIISSDVIKSYGEDSGTNDLIDSYADEIITIKNEKVAYIPYSIGGNNLIELMEKYMYAYYLEELNNPVTLYCVRHNQARQSLPSGYVTYGDIYASFPFDNNLVLTKSDYRYANQHAYTSYYPNGEDPSLVKDSNGDVYLLTIDYLAEHETYGQYLTTLTTYTGMYPRDIMKMYLGNDFPLV